MQLEEACSRLQTLINFYDGLKYLSEIVEAARAADQLQKERNALADQAGKELASIQDKLATAKADQGAAIAKLTDDHARLQSTYAEKSSALESEFNARHTELMGEIQDAAKRLNDAHNEYDAFVASSNEQKAAIQADIDKLQKALSTLKSQVGGML